MVLSCAADRCRRAVTAGAALAVLALLAATAAAQSTYQVVDVGRLTSTGSYFSYAYDVNDLGWVVGSHPPAGVSTFTRRGFLWQPGGAVTFLPFLDPTGLPSTEAHAVTNTGVVVGDSSGNAGQHAFLLIPSIFSDDFESSDTSHWSAVQP
jgi:uncharacterized membrane protein